MSDLKLMPNEGVILKDDEIAHGGTFATYTCELILTNLNIFCIHKTIWGKTKEIKKYPLSQVKVINGRPQVMLTKTRNYENALEIDFRNGSETFTFQMGRKQRIILWTEKLQELLGNGEIDPSEDIEVCGPSVSVADMFKGALDVYKGMLGIPDHKEKSPKQPSTEIKIISTNCSGCSAPISGQKGKTIQCEYCGTKQTL